MNRPSKKFASHFRQLSEFLGMLDTRQRRTAPTDNRSALPHPGNSWTSSIYPGNFEQFQGGYYLGYHENNDGYYLPESYFLAKIQRW
jgi:hypothetical protein